MPYDSNAELASFRIIDMIADPDRSNCVLAATLTESTPLDWGNNWEERAGGTLVHEPPPISPFHQLLRPEISEQRRDWGQAIIIRICPDGASKIASLPTRPDNLNISESFTGWGRSTDGSLWLASTMGPFRYVSGTLQDYALPPPEAAGPYTGNFGWAGANYVATRFCTFCRKVDPADDGRYVAKPVPLLAGTLELAGYLSGFSITPAEGYWVLPIKSAVLPRIKFTPATEMPPGGGLIVAPVSPPALAIP